jgi:hypothetical protein
LYGVEEGFKGEIEEERREGVPLSESASLRNKVGDISIDVEIDVGGEK